MLPSSAVSQGPKPYLTGRGVARAVTDGTELATDNDIEPSFYRIRSVRVNRKITSTLSMTCMRLVWCYSRLAYGKQSA